VTLSTAIRWTIAFIVVSSLMGFSRSKADKKEKSESSQSVDSGTFGIFVKGQRVASETFTIEQKNGVSIVKSQLKEAGGPDAVSQKSDLEITSGGELVKYEWSQSSGGSLSVMPKNDFLTERITAANSSKPAEQAFLLPSTSSILDNNFFVHREVLLWRYLSADCKSDAGNLKCQQDPADFGTLVPQDRTSARVRVELVGQDKVTIHGSEHELLRFSLSGEDFAWSLWVDPQNQFKLMRVAIPADNTEVLRD
jgi:hypothetical protein